MSELEPTTYNQVGVTIDDDDTRHKITEIIERHIAAYIHRNCATAAAATGNMTSEEQAAAQKMIYTMRHLYLAEPWLPALAAAREVLDSLTGTA